MRLEAFALSTAAALLVAWTSPARAGCPGCEGTESATVDPPIDCLVVKAEHEPCYCWAYVVVENGCEAPLHPAAPLPEECKIPAPEGVPAPPTCAEIPKGAQVTFEPEANEVHPQPLKYELEVGGKQYVITHTFAFQHPKTLGSCGQADAPAGWGAGPVLLLLLSLAAARRTSWQPSR